MNDEGVKKLTNGIVIQAVKDYRKSLRGYTVGGIRSDYVVQECEQFFKSNWFSFLTGVDGNYILNKIRKKMGLKEV